MAGASSGLGRAIKISRRVKMRTYIKLAAVLFLAAASQCFAQGGAYPVKPMRWVVPFAPGGGTDVVARPIAQKMSEKLGQSVLYDNRGGAGGVIAGEIVARAMPDGYTLLVAAVAVMTVNPSLMKMPFDPVKDFVPITKFASVPNILAARASFPVRTIQELAPYAKANPGKVLWAQSGTGSGGHLATEMFSLATGSQVTRVFYKGAGPATVALLGNEADVLFANPGVFMPHIKAGRLRPMAVASLQRIAVLPDVPTMIESGFPKFESSSWYGLAAPKGTPMTIVDFLHKEVASVLKLPDITARLALDGAYPVGNTPQEFAQEILDDIARWAKVIKAAGIKL
jgi:tripartite-type tricarboxylate transporter receptor subunit TctC